MSAAIAKGRTAKRKNKQKSDQSLYKYLRVDFCTVIEHAHPVLGIFGDEDAFREQASDSGLGGDVLCGFLHHLVSGPLIGIIAEREANGPH